MKRREFITLLSGAAVAVVTVPLVVAGQDYPSRSITLIVNFPPGGSTDAMARIIREPLSQALGQSIIIDNRGGAGGTTGAAAVANARPDGYTILLSVNSALTTNRYLQKSAVPAYACAIGASRVRSPRPARGQDCPQRSSRTKDADMCRGRCRGKLRQATTSRAR